MCCKKGMFILRMRIPAANLIACVSVNKAVNRNGITLLNTNLFIQTCGVSGGRIGKVFVIEQLIIFRSAAACNAMVIKIINRTILNINGNRIADIRIGHGTPDIHIAANHIDCIDDYSMSMPAILHFFLSARFFCCDFHSAAFDHHKVAGLGCVTGNIACFCHTVDRQLRFLAAGDIHRTTGRSRGVAVDHRTGAGSVCAMLRIPFCSKMVFIDTHRYKDRISRLTLNSQRTTAVSSQVIADRAA